MRRLLTGLGASFVLVASPALANSFKVQVTDSGFSPAVRSIQQGDTVKWQFSPANQSPHSVTDAYGGAFIFNSGPQDPGATFAYTFIGAGRYLILEDGSQSGPTMWVKVPVYVNPLTGPQNSFFQVTWASQAPSGPYVFDAQYLAPGWKKWQSFAKNAISDHGPFKPMNGPGMYQIRARLKAPGNMAWARWSVPVTINVTP